MVCVKCLIFTEYIGAALERTEYKVIEDDGPYFAEVSVLDGVQQFPPSYIASIQAI